ncbi:hypothetical protein GCM10028801_31130 [Nocardioides maradonensis]
MTTRIEHSDDLGLARIIVNEDGKPVCPNNFPHPAHTNAVHNDWHDADVWICEGRDAQ